MKIYADTHGNGPRDYNFTVSSYGRVTATREGSISRWTHSMRNAVGVGIVGYSANNGTVWGVKVKFAGDRSSEYIVDNEQDALKLYSIFYTAMGAS